MRKLFFNFLVSLFALVVVSCNQDKTTSAGIPTINLDPEMDELDYRLSAITNDLEVVALETNPNSLISSMSHLISVDENFIIYRSSTTVIIFNAQGEFLNKIDAEGAGPQEYATIAGVFFDAEQERIYIVDNRDIKIYDIHGKFLKILETDFSPAGIYRSEAGNFIVPDIQHYKEKNRNMLSVFDSSMVQMHSFKSRNSGDYSSIKQNLFFAGSPYEIEGNIYYKEPFVDTIYKIGVSDTTITPHWKISIGDYKMKTDIELNISAREEASAKGKISSPGILETSDHFFMEYNYRDAIYLSLLDKKENSFVFHKKYSREELRKTGELGIRNDLESTGPSFWPDLIDNDRLVQAIFPVSLSEEQRRNYNVAEDDNPVLFIIKEKDLQRSENNQVGI